MDPIKILGLVAGSLTTISFLPQVIKTWKSRSAKDLSLAMFAVFCLGTALWLTYGILIASTPVIFANSITLLLCGVLLYFKFTFKD